MSRTATDFDQVVVGVYDDAGSVDGLARQFRPEPGIG